MEILIVLKIIISKMDEFGEREVVENPITEIPTNNYKTNDYITNLPTIQTTLINVDNSHTYINVETTNINTQGINENVESIVLTDNKNNNSQDINQKTELTIQSSFIQNTIYEKSSQDVNYNVETMIINGVVFSCNNEEFYKGKCDYENHRPTKKDIVDKFRDDITNHKIDDLLPTEANQEDLIIKDNKTSYQITNSYNQIYKVYHDISSIKLGECEKTLKDIYHIDYETPLLIFKIDNFIDG